MEKDEKSLKEIYEGANREYCPNCFGSISQTGSPVISENGNDLTMVYECDRCDTVIEEKFSFSAFVFKDKNGSEVTFAEEINKREEA